MYFKDKEVRGQNGDESKHLFRLKQFLPVVIIIITGFLLSACGGSSKPSIIQSKASISNTSPVVTSTAESIAYAGVRYQYSINAFDADSSDQLLYSLFTGPKGMKINRNSGKISWKPSTLQLGNHYVIVQVRDNGQPVKAGYQSFIINVTTANGGNTNQTLIAFPDFISANKNTSVSIPVLNNDEGDTGNSELTAISQPNHGEIKILADKTITYTPNTDYRGVDEFIYQLNNGSEITSATVKIYVDCTECNQDKMVELSWSPSVTGINAGYLIYYGNHENETNNIAFDLSNTTGLIERTPSVQLSIKDDLRLETGNRVCFRISAYIDYLESELSEPICGIL